MRPRFFLLAAAASVCAAGGAHAEDALKLLPAESPMVLGNNDFGDVGVADLGQMDGLRGREGGMSVTVATDQDLSASVVGGAISADNFTTGGVNFGEHAFDNFGGVGLVNVVTGNNNAIEAAIGVTFNLLD